MGYKTLVAYKFPSLLKYWISLRWEMIIMNKKIVTYSILGAMFVLSACLKAYEAPVTVTPTPYNVWDVGGIYKEGTLNLEKTLLDSVTYKIKDDTSSVTLSYYVQDTVFVSINTNSSVTDKRYKVYLYDSIKSTLYTTYKFRKNVTDTSYYLFKKDYGLDVTLYYPAALKKSYAYIYNSSIKSQNPSTIYIENVSYIANRQ